MNGGTSAAADDALASLARFQTKDADNRGGCRVCGGLGHMTKQCRNRADILQNLRQAQAEQKVYELVKEPEPQPVDENLSDSLLSSDSESDRKEKKRKREKKKRKHKKSKKSKKSSSSDDSSSSSSSSSSDKKKRKKKRSKKSKKESSSSSSSSS